MCLAYLATSLWCFLQSVVTTEKEASSGRGKEKGASLQPECSQGSGGVSLLNRDVLSATVVFDTWSFLTPGKGKFLWLSENQKGLRIFSLSSTEHYLWSEFYSVVLSSVIQSLCHWVRIQKYPSSSSLQQLLYSALLVHTVIRFKNYTVFNTIFISNWNCCLFLFRWKSLHKVCKPGKATWWSIVCEETEYSR